MTYFLLIANKQYEHKIESSCRYIFKKNKK